LWRVIKDLFYFTENDGFLFHNLRSKLFHIEQSEIFHSMLNIFMVLLS